MLVTLQQDIVPNYMVWNFKKIQQQPSLHWMFWTNKCYFSTTLFSCANRTFVEQKSANGSF